MGGKSKQAVVVDPMASRTATHRRFLQVARLVKLLCAPWVTFDCSGLDEWPRSGPLIMAPNHRSMFDIAAGLAVFAELGWSARLLITDKYFENRLFRWILLSIGAIPVAIDKGGLAAVREATKAVRAGESIVVLAEGRIVPATERVDGLGDLHAGVGLIARRSGAPVVPYALIGTDSVWPAGARFPTLTRRHLVVGRVGVPLDTFDAAQFRADFVTLLSRAEPAGMPHPAASRGLAIGG